PIQAGGSLVSSTGWPRAQEFPSFAHLLHKCIGCGGVLGCSHRHDRFGPGNAGDRGFTPLVRFPSQLLLRIPPQSAHEMVSPTCRSRSFGPLSTVSGSAYLLLRLSAWSASLASPTPCSPTPSADSCATVGSPHDSPSSNNRTVEQ